MSPFRTIDPEVLRNYHHLTPQQINKIYGCKVISESPASTAVSLANFRELCLIAEAFQQSNIDFISLKGPLLAYRLNSDVTSRYYTDLDILIEPLSVDKADRVLGELGYTNSGVAWPRNERKQRRLSWHDNQIGYCHTDRMLIVELHWRLFATPSVSDKQLLDIVGSNLTEILISGRSFKVLSNELELLYLIIHGGNHFWKRLKWLADVDYFMEKKEINQEKFNHLVSLLRAERSVAIFVAIYLKWYPEHRKRLQNILDITCCKAPRGMISFAQARISEGEDKKHDSIIGIVQALIFSLRSFPGLRYKLRKIRSYLFIKEYYGQSRFFSSIPIFYFYSAFKLCVNRLRR